MQAVNYVLESTSKALWVRGAGCLRGIRTYLPGNVVQGCRLFMQCLNLHPGTVYQGCRLLKSCQFLPFEQVRGTELDTVLLLFED